MPVEFVLNKNKTKIEKKYGYFVLNNKYYEFGSQDGGTILKLIPKAKINKKLLRVKKLAKILKENVDAEKILIESIMASMTEKDIEKLENTVFHKKRKYTAKTREHHCVDLKVGNCIVPLIP